MDIPSEAIDATRALQLIFGTDLVAVYLYGSAATGSLRPNSDVDVLAIVGRLTTSEARRAVGRELLRISGPYPPVSGEPRPLEVSIFDQQLLANFRHPVRGEFVYGEWLRQAFEAGEEPQPTINPDFTLLFAQVRQEGIALFGVPAPLALPLVDAEDVRRAIQDSLPDLLGYLEGDERNVILTLARMWFTMSTGHFASKDIAADWAARQVEPGIASTLLRARDGYVGSIADEWHSGRLETRRAAEYLGNRVRAVE